MLLTPRTSIAQAVNYCSALGIHRRLYCANVQIEPASEPVSVDGETVVYRNVFSDRETKLADVRTIVYATPRRADDALAAPLADLDPALIGDCMSPRNRLVALHEGQLLAREL